MSPEVQTLMAQIMDATRTIEIATSTIQQLRGVLANLEEENARLRARLVKAMAVIEHYESPGDS